MRGFLLNLSIYLDDCAFSYRLREMLIEAGHKVQIPADVDPPLTGAKDHMHFEYARTNHQVLLTYNPEDFRELHRQTPNHSGIFGVYQDNDPTRDMTYSDVVRAINNLLEIQPDLNNGFWTLNHYQW